MQGQDGAQGDQARGKWDHVATQLQAWRREAGDPSYAEIAARISAARIWAGSTPEAARLGRTTVYDAFRLGRARVNHELVREIATALGATHEQASELLNRREAFTHRASRPAPQPTDVPTSVATPEPLPAPTAEEQADGPRAGWHPAARSFLIMIGCLGLNLLGREVVDGLGLPVYLDMVGTALAAVVLGPWRGAAVGASTNLVGALTGGWASGAFVIVNVAGALLWGYGVHRWGMGRTMARFFALSSLVALTCSLLAVPILWFFFDGSIGHSQDDLTASMMELTQRFAVAVSLGNLMTSLADKLISGFVALVGASLLGVQLATEPSRRQPWISPQARRGAMTQSRTS